MSAMFMTEEELAFVMDQSAAEFGQSVVDGSSFTMEYTTLPGNRSAVVLDHGWGSFAQVFKVLPPCDACCRPPPAAARRRRPTTHHLCH